MVSPTIVGLAAASCMVSSMIRTLTWTKYNYVNIIRMKPFVFTHLFRVKRISNLNGYPSCSDNKVTITALCCEFKLGYLI